MKITIHAEQRFNERTNYNNAKQKRLAEQAWLHGKVMNYQQSSRVIMTFDRYTWIFTTDGVLITMYQTSGSMRYNSESNTKAKMRKSTRSTYRANREEEAELYMQF